MPAPVSPWAARLLAAAACLGACDPEPGPRPPVDYPEDLARDIPMTGKVTPLFAEVDTVMRQFVKWRCVGAGTLAISYKGRRIYKRGFGRMNGRASEALVPGCGEDPQNPFDPDAALVQPDTPMYLGSVSKPIAAAVARWLLEERLAAHPELLPAPCDGPLCSCDDPPCPATLTDLSLLDPAQDLLPAQLGSLLRGEVPVAVNQAEAPCARGHDTDDADPRWRQITVGNLLSHQSGLERSGGFDFFAPGGALENLAQLRGYADRGESPWRDEDASIRKTHSARGPAIDAAAAWISARNEGAPVYFVNGYNVLAGERPLDEFIKNNAGFCLEYTPGTAGRYTDDDGLYAPIGQDGLYSNFGYMLLGRIIDHLQQARNGGLYTAEYGRPETHLDSALAEFVAEKLELSEGVESPEGIYMGQQNLPLAPGQALGHPIPRIWAWSSYGSMTPESKRPYCVWRDNKCDFQPWAAGNERLLPEPNLAPNLVWDLVDDQRGFAGVPLWADKIYYHQHAGALVSEAPVYLEFARKYNISGRSDLRDNGNGSERINPLVSTSGHNGSVGGGYAIVLQMVGRTVFRSLPPVVDGHLVDDFDQRQTQLFTVPDFVDFVVAVNQNNDPRCASHPDACALEYAMIRAFVEFGLSQVDWTAVDEMLAGQRDEVVGMAIADGVTQMWFADDHHLVWPGPPGTFPGRGDDGDPATPPVRVQSYDLPSTRIGPDVLGIAVDRNGHVVAWYDDGRVSTGSPHDLASRTSPTRFTMAPGQLATDIVAVAMSSDGYTHAWYADGTWSTGTRTGLASVATGRFDLPPGYEPGDISAIAFQEPTDPQLPDLVWTRFSDGATRLGSIEHPGATP